jgi:Ca-activated chloride channel family protein
MSAPHAFRRASLSGLAVLIAASSPSAPFAALPSGDGDPSPEACQALGFNPPPPPGYNRNSPGMSELVVSGQKVSPNRAPPPPPPPPPPFPAGQQLPTIPPLPIPPVQQRIGQPYSPSPARMDTERYPHAQANPVKRTAEEPVSTLSADVDTAAYANVRRFLNDGRKPPSDAVRVEELINYFDYGYAAPTDPTTPFKPFVAVTPSPWSKDRQILQIGLQGYDIPRRERPPLNLVFLIDTSGSMASEDRLPLARKALNVLIDQLRPQDRVAMVAYAGSAGAVLTPSDGRQRLKMRCALEALHSGGSTAGGQGLALAYALAKQNFDPKAVNRVVLMTDGDFNVGVADPAKLKDVVAETRKDGVYLSVYGFGRGNYNDTMMQTLAQNGNGTAAYVDTLSEARRLFRDDFGSSLFPIADDVKIQVEFNPARVSEYRLIGYETRLLNREDFNNDRVDAGEVGSKASVTALYEITPKGAKASSDPLRYGSRHQPVMPNTAGSGSEIAFLKVRYKLPGQSTSKLISRPIGAADVYGAVGSAPESTRWALAVAGFGQKLRGDPWLEESFGWTQIADLAQGARGQDPFGLRAEFVQLVHAADGARSMNQ